jgi:8-oxo-dGTP pyrophosphatase MutT (NUDIX family)
MTSKGVLIIQHTKHGNSILLVEKSYTYGFVDFLRAGKRMLNERFVHSLLLDMTKKEKLDLLTLPFTKLWYRVNCKPPRQTDEENFILIRSKPWFIRSVGSLSKKTLWEIPKGKKRRNESDLDTALRELEEETSISKDKIHLTGQIVDYVIQDRGSFPVKYFIAHTDEELSIDFSKIDKFEVSDVRWVPVKDIYKYNGSEVIYEIIKNLFLC